jgi:B12-binding domain/radical SAM domain protein
VGEEVSTDAMSAYDIVLIHPPAVFDFRKKPIFPGALGRTMASVQFNKVPIGMLSIADYLDRHGYKVVVDNLCDRMLTVPGFDVEQHLREYSAQIYAVGLNFQQHAPGALAIAKLCKDLHPDALVIMGGLTATRFHEEIIAKYEFVDAVVRAEAEKPLLELMRAYETHGRLTPTPNLTFRAGPGAPTVTPLMEASRDLDDFEFTRLDLLSPQTSVYIPDAPSRWSLVVSRGCAYDCTICGGSAYTYEKYLGMSRPAFRSPAKLVADIKRLVDQNVRFIGLYQDPRVGGKSYWQELFARLIEERPRFERLSLDLLAPAGEDYISEIAKIGRNVILHFCPDTGSDEVRRTLGRHYSNDAIRETIKTCLKYRIPVTNFFSVGLAGESEKEMRETWKLWQELDALNKETLRDGGFDYVKNAIPTGGQVLGPIVLDPGSRAFDDPQAHGYRLLYKDLEQYVEALSQPTWDQWLNYETELLDKSKIVDMIYQTTEFTIDQRERQGLYGGSEAHYERCHLHADRVILDEMAKVRALGDPEKSEDRAVAMRETLDALERKRTFFQMTFLGDAAERSKTQ